MGVAYFAQILAEGSDITIDKNAVDEIKRLIDYYNGSQATPWINYLSIVAIVISVLAIFATFKQTKSAERGHIRSEWNGIVDACIRNGKFIDITYTSAYKHLSPDLRLVYEAFCYKVWSLVDYIVQSGLQAQNPYDAIFRWSVAFHRDWLQDNPYMFSSAKFWKEYEKIRNEPLTLFRNPVLPRVDAKPAIEKSDRYTDNIDWDIVHRRYHDYVISPWAPLMTKKDNITGKTRNEIINYLDECDKEVLKELRILDFGCGPGNILEHLDGRVSEIYGLDISESALAIAGKRADDLGVKFTPILADMRTFVGETKFDLIISANSILPVNREDIPKMFKTIKHNLAPYGKLIAILPSYDTCEALMSYWEEVYKARAKRDGDQSDEYVRRCVEALRLAKKMDKDTLSFADDGVHSQCLHTPDSIRHEFAVAGLKLNGEMIKVKYPWEYAREFDYGFFPNKDEIWDWFVKAERL